MRKIATLLALCMFLCIQVTQAQKRTITGTVTNAADGTTLPGVSVVAKGTTSGATTDIDGNYKIVVPADAKTLVFSFVGMTTKEVEINNRVTINVALDPAMEQLDEVVVTALGISREKKSLGYSVQEVDGNDLNKAPELNVVNSLSGQAAGVQIISGGGGIGSSSRIMIRGNSSFNNNQPLFVVDGVPISNYSSSVGAYGAADEGPDFGNAAMDIDPSNIKSVSVLKGANAAALYGSRAANGVIVIETKKPKLTHKKGQAIGVSYTGSVTFDEVYIIPNYQNDYGQGFDGSEYLYNYYKANPQSYNEDWTSFPYSSYHEWAANESFSYYDGNWSGVNDGIDESWGPRLDDGLKLPQFNSPYTIKTDDDGEKYLDYTPTPWESNPDNVKDFFETGVTFNNNVALTTAGKKAAARLSLTNTDATGAIPNTDLTKNAINFGGTLHLTDRLKADASVNYINNQSDNLPGVGYGPNNVMQSIGSWFGRQVDMNELEKNWEEEDYFGNPYNWNHSYHNNPYWTVNKNTTSRQRDRVFGNVNLTYQLTDWLDVMGRLGHDYYNEYRKHREAHKSLDYPNGMFWERNLFEKETNLDLLFNINKSLLKSSSGQDFSEDILTFNSTLGANYRRYDYRTSYMQAAELTVPELYTIGNAKGNASTEMLMKEKETNSILGQMSFGYKYYLYLDFSFRNDWSSALPSDNWSFFYPSVSLSFIPTEVFTLPEFISFAKLRASWANVGNDTDPYQLQTLYGTASPFNGVTQFRYGFEDGDFEMANSELKPENIESTEAGIDLRFLNDRLGIDFTYYDKITTDQIMPVAVSRSTGFDRRWINAGEIENEGIELMLRGAPFRSQDGFNWDITLNFAQDNSVVNDLYEDLESYQIAYAWGVSVEARPGEEFGEIYGAGFLRDGDDNIIVNTSGIPVATPEPVSIGNVMPEFTGGFRNTFGYKNINLSVLLDFRKGGDIYSITKQFGAYSGILEETVENGIREDGVVAGSNVMEDENFVYGGLDGDDIVYYDDQGNEVGAPVTNKTDVAAQSYFANYYGLKEYNIIDGSFLKLREVSLSYNLPKKWFENNFVNSASVAVIGRNLALLMVHESNDAGIDPEVGMGNDLAGFGIEQYNLPPSRSIGFKLNLNL